LFVTPDETEYEKKPAITFSSRRKTKQAVFSGQGSFYPKKMGVLTVA
jgi:hypothetical protein